VARFDNPGFGEPAYRHQEAFFEVIRLSATEWSSTGRKYAQNAYTLCSCGGGDGAHLEADGGGAVHSGAAITGAGTGRFGLAVRTAVFWNHFWASTLRVMVAMAVAWSVASAGIVLGSRPRIDSWIAPFIFITYPVPKIVLLRWS